MKVLVLTAHPDDAEINCGGTIAKYLSQGHAVHCVQACSGDKGSARAEPAQLSRIRKQESEAAAQLIGAKSGNLGIPDAELQHNQQFLHMFINEIRKAEPDVMITHALQDYHPDHVACGQLAVDASFLATVPAVCPDIKAVAKTPQIYFMEPYTGINFAPEEFVDISDFLETKLSMMACHKSQLAWLSEHDSMDILEYITIAAKYRGFQCGVRYAEGFVRYRTALRVNPGSFLP